MRLRHRSRGDGDRSAPQRPEPEGSTDGLIRRRSAWGRFTGVPRLIGIAGLLIFVAANVIAADHRVLSLTIHETTGRSSAPREVDSKVDLNAWTWESAAGKRKGGQRIVYTWSSPDGSAALRLPIGCLEIDRKGQPRLKLVHPLEPLTGTLLQVFGVDQLVPEERLRSRTPGEDRIEGFGLRMNAKIPVTYEVDESTENPDELIYRVEMVGDPVESSFGRNRIVVSALHHELVFDKESLRLVRGIWSRAAAMHAGSNILRLDSRIELVEKSHRELTPAEQGVIEKEYAILEPIALATLPGGGDDDIDKLQVTLTQYEQKHPKSPFLPSIPSLAAALEQRVAALDRPKDPSVLGKALVGKKAPEFKLKDLEGRDVSLADFTGKILLITFWGYA
ncbi:MAG: redoxin domain-containing protein [Planctomycetes bacterium]|nr:redoxin domain-containing protein [Planctomycetota bacterium]